MKIDDILTLVNAGFTKADIMAFAAGQGPQQEAQEGQQSEQEQPAQQEEQQEHKQEHQQDPNAELMTALADVKKTLSLMQQANLQNDKQPDGANKQQTSEDVWKNFFEKE